MADKKKAVTFGRFNFFSKGHEEFIKKILQKYDELYLIVLFDGKYNFEAYKCDNKTKKFLKECDKNHRSKKNINIMYRLAAIKKIFKKELAEGKIKIIPMYRPETHKEEFNILFPEQNFDMVFSKDQKKLFDRTKIRFFRKIFNRDIVLVDVSFVIHNSDIKKTQQEQYFDEKILKYYYKKGIL